MTGDDRWISNNKILERPEKYGGTIIGKLYTVIISSVGPCSGSPIGATSQDGFGRVPGPNHHVLVAL